MCKLSSPTTVSSLSSTVGQSYVTPAQLEVYETLERKRQALYTTTMSSEPVIIKKRSRPQARIREKSIEQDPEDATSEIEDEKNLPFVPSLHYQFTHFTHRFLHSLEDLIDLRKLRRAREGIDVGKLNKGDPKKKKKKTGDEATSTPTGLIKSARKEVIEDEE